MKLDISAAVCAGSVIIMVCGTACAGPAMNAQQFQQKAVSQALSKSTEKQYAPSKPRYQGTAATVINTGNSQVEEKAEDLRLKPDETKESK